MQDYIRCDAVEQLQHAWREAAFGAPEYAKQHIDAVEELLESSESNDAALSFVEAARSAVQHNDSLGVVLALVAALQELERGNP